MMLIYYKTWIYQCLIKQVKSPSIYSRTPNSVRIRQTGRAGNRGVTIEPILAHNEGNIIFRIIVFGS